MSKKTGSPSPTAKQRLRWILGCYCGWALGVGSIYLILQPCLRTGECSYTRYWLPFAWIFTVPAGVPAAVVGAFGGYANVALWVTWPWVLAGLALLGSWSANGLTGKDRWRRLAYGWLGACSLGMLCLLAQRISGNQLRRTEMMRSSDYSLLP